MTCMYRVWTCVDRVWTCLDRGTVNRCKTPNQSMVRSSHTGGAREVAGRAGAADFHRHRQRAHLWLRRAWSAPLIHVHLLSAEDRVCTRAITDPGRSCITNSPPVQSTVVGSLAVSAGLLLGLVCFDDGPASGLMGSPRDWCRTRERVEQQVGRDHGLHQGGGHGQELCSILYHCGVPPFCQAGLNPESET